MFPSFCHIVPELSTCSIINGNFRILNWRYLPHIRPIFQAYVREYTPQNMALYGTNVPPSVGSWRSPMGPSCSHWLVHDFSTMAPTFLSLRIPERSWGWLAGRHVNSQMGQQAAGHLRGLWDMNGYQTQKTNMYLNLIAFMNLEKIVLQ